MIADAEWYWLARERSRALAVEMVRLEDLARHLERLDDYAGAGEALWARDRVADERYELVRELRKLSRYVMR